MKGVKFRFIKIFAKGISSKWFLIPYINKHQRNTFINSADPVRYASIFLAIEQLLKNNIEGSLAECGVYKGHLSKFLHSTIPDRQLFLFDTFSGFDSRDVDSSINDNRFRDTSVDHVLKYIGDTNNIIIRKGFFPDSAIGLEHEKFALVIIDFDKYEPTLAALDFFYSRINSGGFIFIHDYNSPESNWACSRALDKFLADKIEKPIAIPDAWGSVVFRKI